MIDWLANSINKHELQGPAILFLESISPVSVIGSQLSKIFIAPFLEVFGVNGYDWASLFRKRENISRLLKKIGEQPN